MFIAILVSAFMTLALFIIALITAMMIRKSRTAKRKLYVSHRILAVAGIVVAIIHAVIAYNFYVYKFF